MPREARLLRNLQGQQTGSFTARLVPIHTAQPREVCEVADQSRMRRTPVPPGGFDRLRLQQMGLSEIPFLRSASRQEIVGFGQLRVILSLVSLPDAACGLQEFSCLVKLE